MVHDVRVWRTPTAACGVIVFDVPSKVDLVIPRGFRVVVALRNTDGTGPMTDEPVSCMSCLAARRTPYAVLCEGHGQQFLTEAQYDYQMSRPNARWACPRCGEDSGFDDEEYEHGIGDP